jgi:hypothetical protein
MADTRNQGNKISLVHKMQDISAVPLELLASELRCCFLELVFY